MASASAVLFVPPLIAIALYLFFYFALVPLYRRRQRYMDYIPVNIPSTPLPLPTSLVTRTRERILNALSPYINVKFPWQPGGGGGDRTASFDSFAGDEELEEAGGFSRDGADGGIGRRHHNYDEPSERRLSRDLEAGFRDDSDEEDEADDGSPGSSSANGLRRPTTSTT